MSLSRGSWAIVAWCFHAAARGGEPGPGTQSTVRDSAGVAIVENTGPGWSSGAAWRVSSKPILRIGSVDAATPSVGGPAGPAGNFSYVLGATRLSDGSVVVLEGQSSELRWFASDGAHRRTRGGRGGGPGEFRGAAALLRLPGDTLVVPDGLGLRRTLFTSSGELVGTETTDPSRYRALGQWVECESMTLPDRSLLGCQPEPGLPASAPDRPGLLRTFARYVLVPPTLASRRPLGLHGGIEQWGVRGGDGRITYAVHPFHAWTRVTAGGDPLRVAIAVNPAYSIELWRTDGVLDRIVRRTHARRAATPEELDQAASSMIGSADPAAMNLPPRFRIHDAGDDYVLGVRSGEYDVPFVEMYSLERR